MPNEIPQSMKEELGAWNNGTGVSLETWIEIEGNFKLAVGYSALFWPTFVTFEDYILIDGFSVDNVRAFEDQQGSKSRNVEWVLNHLHLVDLHPNDEDDLSADKLLVLGNTMREMWSAKLKVEFPDRPCVVDFYVPDDREEFVDYQISFWQEAWDD